MNVYTLHQAPQGTRPHLIRFLITLPGVHYFLPRTGNQVPSRFGPRVLLQGPTSTCRNGLGLWLSAWGCCMRTAGYFDQRIDLKTPCPAQQLQVTIPSPMRTDIFACILASVLVAVVAAPVEVTPDAIAAPPWRKDVTDAIPAPGWKRGTTSADPAPGWKRDTDSTDSPDWRRETGSTAAPPWKRDIASAHPTPDWKRDTDTTHTPDWRRDSDSVAAPPWKRVDDTTPAPPWKREIHEALPAPGWRRTEDSIPAPPWK